MSNQIAQTNVSIQYPGTPNTLLRTGAFMSQGGTNQPAGSLSLLTSPADLTPILASATPANITSAAWVASSPAAISQALWENNPTASLITTATWASGVLSINCAGGNNLVGDVRVTIAGLAYTGLGNPNGTFFATWVDSDDFTVPLAADPGIITVGSATAIATVKGITLNVSGGHGLPPGVPIEVTVASLTYTSANPNGNYLATIIDAYNLDYQLLSTPGTLGQTGTVAAQTSSMEITCSGGHNLGSSTNILTTINNLGFTGSNNPNGKFTVTIINPDIFTYPFPPSPGTLTTTNATVTNTSASELVDMTTTYFAQGASNGVYVLELGADTLINGVSALDEWLITYPNELFALLAMREWDESELTRLAFQTLCSNYNANGTVLAFFVTTNLANYSSWASTTGLKSAMVGIEAPVIPSTEFTMAGFFYRALNYAPSSASPVNQYNYGYLFGVTAYPGMGNKALLQNLQIKNINYVGTGAQGGISENIVWGGNFLSGQPYNFWYAIYWAIINGNQTLANAVINNANNQLNPFGYNQIGIDFLQNAIANLWRNGVSYGIILGDVITTKLDPATFAANVNNGLYAGNAVINAIPFAIYSQQNPADYALESYGGFQGVLSPQLGFNNIIFNLLITENV